MKKILALYGDKLLFILFLVYALYVIIVSVAEISIESKEIKDANKIIADLEKQKNPPPKNVEAIFLKEFNKNKSEWPKERKLSRSVFFKDVTFDFDSLLNKYLASKKEHQHEFYEVPVILNEENYLMCIFPGCSEKKLATDANLANVEKIEEHYVTPMAVVIKWAVPEHKMVEVTHSVVRKRKYNKNLTAEQDWEMVKGHDDELLKLMPGGKELTAAVEKEQEKEMTIADLDKTLLQSITYKGGDGAEILNSKAKKDVVSFKMNAGLDRHSQPVPGEPGVENLDNTFVLRDRDVEPGIEYEYQVMVIAKRVRAVNEEEVEKKENGEEVADKEVDEKELVMKTAWSPIIRVKTLGVERIKFLGYYASVVPGQPDRIRVEINNVYDPPWKGNKYIISYSYSNIMVGAKGKNNIGILVKSYSLEAENGNPVLYNQHTQEFIYVGDEKGTGEKEYKDAYEKKNIWKKLRPNIDFTTPWLADKVREDVEKLVTKTKVFNPKTGGYDIIDKIKMQYRYFLVMKHKKTGEIKELELKRDKLDRKLTNS